jgi:DNA-binding CsgD family transcriptional regulator
MLGAEARGAQSSARWPGGRLLGRERERDVLDRLLSDARGGRGSVLVVHGEPGVGKTALLEYAVQEGHEFRVEQTSGVQAEMELPFAAVQQLCSPTLELMEHLPEPQREALGVAFGLRTGPAPNPFLLGLAILGLISEAAEERPVLVVVDDAQWLDRASARVLAFVARRLLAERVALVFATREPGAVLLAGFPELHVQPLGHRDARELLESVLPARLDESVLERIVAETRGNPLALLELPRGLSPSQLAGGFGLPAAVPMSASIEESFTRRLATLPYDARRLLLVAAADPVGDPALLWGAAERLGIPESAADVLESEHLLTLTPRVVFRHPLVRSAIYGAAGRKERREVHRALADATNPEIDPDRRAWHRAHATSAPDEDVAADLERSAARAQARSGFAAAAAFLERSSALTPDPARRAGRALAAAQAAQQAGALDTALDLAATAEAGPITESQRAQVDVLRARISFAVDRGSEAPPLLLKAAKRVESLDGPLARDIYLDALTAAMFAGRLGGAGIARSVAGAALAAPPSASPPRAAELLLDGLALVITDGPSAGTPVLRQALDAFRGDEIRTEEGLRWLWLAGRAAAFIWDYENWDALTAKQIRLSREFGALTVLPLTLSTRAGVELFAGKLDRADSLVQEATAVAEATDSRGLPPASLALAAFRGHEPDALQLIETSTRDVIARGEGMGLTLAQWASALLHNGLARYEDALAAADQAAEDPRELWFSTWTMVELVEAAVRSGHADRANEALQYLTDSTRASGTPWALGVEARSRALVSDGPGAEALYREAIDHLGPTRLRVEEARAHLLYGEWLRRERRRLDAREQLRAAHELFSDFGMEAFAERARVELEATGERARKRTVETLDQLTPQEAQIARLAAQGETNREIAAQLFISPSTVEYHLRKAFRKLDVKSRTQLVHRLR